MDDNKSTLTRIFNQFDRDELVLHEIPETVTQIETIKNKETKVRQRMRQHCDRNWMTWAKKEQDRIFLKKFGEVRPEYNLGGSKTTWEEARRICFNKARLVINQRVDNRYQYIKTSSQNMQQGVMERSRQQFKDQNFARKWLEFDVKQIHDSFRYQRMDAYRDFEAEKGQRIKDALAAGKENPASYVYNSYKQQDHDLRLQKEHALRQAYQNHGFNYHNDEHALTKKFNFNM